MELLEFARGPALTASILILVFGVTWRFVSLFLRARQITQAPARPGSPSSTAGAISAIVGRMWPAKPFRDKASVPTAVAYVFHLGILVVVLLGTPHILFLGDFLGFTWPGLPKGIIDVVSGVTIGALLFALFYRLHHPVRRHLSNADDYIAWTVTFLPMVTGMIVTSELFPRYELWLAIHILSVELLFIWLPFGKLMHAFFWVFSRGTTGARFAHRGARS